MYDTLYRDFSTVSVGLNSIYFHAFSQQCLQLNKGLMLSTVSVVRPYKCPVKNGKLIMKKILTAFNWNTQILPEQKKCTSRNTLFLFIV